MRVHAALLSLALLATAACASSSSPATGAGGASTTSSSAGGAGGSGSSTHSTTTSSTSSTTGAGGSGGATGSPCAGAFKFPQPACQTCLEAGCCAELAACAASSSCAACVTGGSAKDCTDAKALASALEDCNTTKCKKACTPPPPPIDCTAPLDLGKVPSGGKCIAIDKKKVACNPVTQEGCDAANGEACDVQTSGGALGFQCYKGTNTAKLCGDCDGVNGPFCAPGTSCDGGGCARFCCDDTDCSPGATCTKTAFQPDYAIGVCQTAAPQKDGGA